MLFTSAKEVRESLPAGLNWTNRLLVDGSIEVIAATTPSSANTRLAGTNLLFAGSEGTPNVSFIVLASTNVASPFSNWMTIATNRSDSSGNF